MTSTRTYVVTGSASGIGRATRTRLESLGARVIGADLRDAEVEVDLAREDGRNALVEQVAALCGGRLNGVIAAAGVVSADELAVHVNYFGAVATLEGLRPLLARSEAPAAAVIASVGALLTHDPSLVAACLAGDEEAAAATAAGAIHRGADRGVIYSSTKRALVKWLRRRAIAHDWAGAGIPLNALSPGVIATPMMQAALDDPAARVRLTNTYPMPLGGIGASPEHPAAWLAWLTSDANRLATGQVIYIDGGYEAVVRGDDIFASPTATDWSTQST